MSKIKQRKKGIAKRFSKNRKDVKSSSSHNYLKRNNLELIRLNKYVANTGLCSRREADKIIASGAISVNGKTVTEMGVKVCHDDIVKYNDRILKKEKMVYVLLNKPKDFITTVKDPQARKTVLILIKSACKERIYPVGRLDRNTTGLLLFTNDGALTKKLTHPKYGIKKMYHVVLDKNLKKTDINKIARGIDLKDGKAEVDAIDYVAESTDKKQVGVELHSGKNKIIRRIFEHFGYRVEKLDRVLFAGLTKKNLPRGKWRYLSKKEVGMLMMIQS